MERVYILGRSEIKVDMDTGRLADREPIEASRQKTGMTSQECMASFKQLSHGQGFYSKLYNDLRELERNNADDFKIVMRAFEMSDFQDPVDLVLYLET